MTSDPPWPGPRPYNEHQRHLFFGRRPDIDAIVGDHLLRWRVSVLTGESGTGKTSLLSAGVFPRLWLMRCQELREQGRTTTPPALLLRSWNAPTTTTDPQQAIDVRILHALREAIERAHRFLQNESEATTDSETATILHSQADAMTASLERIDSSSTPFEAVVAMAEEHGGLLLVLDQFEEILRNPTRKASQEALHFTEKVYYNLPSVHTLLSLRREYLSALSSLDRQIESFSRAKYHLEPMQRDALRGAALAAARVGGVDLEPGIVDALLDRLEEQEDQVEPMVFQVVLHYLYQEALNSANGARPSMDDSCLERFLAASGGETTLQNSMSRWIGERLDLALSSKGDTIRVGDKIWPSHIRSGFLRRTAVRIIPHMAAGTFKVPRTEPDLFMKAFIQERSRLEDGAGVARTWTPDVIEEQLRIAIHDTLSGMEREGIVKMVRIGTSPEASWELVHDRLAQPLDRWANDHRTPNWEDAVCAITTMTGEDIIPTNHGRNRPTGLVEGVRWAAAWIGSDGSERPMFADLVFRDCDLKGAMFDNVVFKNVRFERCDLGGSLFKDCDFIDAGDRPAVAFVGDGTTTRGLSFWGGSMGAAVFEDCPLLQLWMAHIECRGTWTVKASDGPASMSQCLFEGMTGDPVRGGWRFPGGYQLDHACWDAKSAPFFQPSDTGTPLWATSGRARLVSRVS